MIKTCSALAALTLVAASGMALHAQVLLNGDFSNPPTSSYTSSAPTDFTAISLADDTGVISTTVNYIGGLSTNPISPQIEYQAGGATTARIDTATAVGLYQVVGALQANTTYTFTAGEALSSEYSGSGTFELALYTAASATDPLALQSLQTYTDTASSSADFNQFQFESTPSFTTGANPTGYLTVVLSYANGDVSPGGQAYFAEASLTATPEPSTWALMLLGLGGLALGLRQRATRIS
jgi:hypothetical protein